MSNYSYMPWIARKIAFIWKVCVSLSCETISNWILDKKTDFVFWDRKFHSHDEQEILALYKLYSEEPLYILSIT